MSNDQEIKRGLDGVVVDTTTISEVNPEINSLIYRGYPVQELAEHCCFEEVAYLLWHGELPNRAQLDEFTALERSLRDISPALLSVIRQFPKDAHPMDTLRTGVSFLGMEDSDIWGRDPETNLMKSMNLLAKMPTIIAADYRCRRGQEPVAPRTDLSFSENFFQMCFGKVPAPEIVKAFDVSLILYAEHSFNASTFTARVVSSTLSDIYSAVTGAVGALKGPLHGGANEAVMHTLLEIGEPARAQEWIDAAIREKRLVMGFGHRVYKKGDSRVPTMKKYMLKIAEITAAAPGAAETRGGQRWVEISQILETTMIERKGIHPNLDFPSGPAYYMMGFEIDMFTPFFAMSRITGWTAHIMEQVANNRLIRPLSRYEGTGNREVPPIECR